MDVGIMATRASDADRSYVMEQLRESAAEGRLSMDELSERIGEVVSSKTYGDLYRSLRELPGQRSFRPRQKVGRNEVEVVAPLPRRRHKTRFVAPVIVAVVALFFLGSLSGIVASIILLPLKVVFYLAVIGLALRLFRSISRPRR